MTAVIWCCVFNLSWAASCRVYVFSPISLVTFFLFNVFKRFFYSCHVFTFINVFLFFWTFFTSMFLTVSYCSSPWAPLPSPFWCDPPFTRTFKAFHYQWGPLKGPFYPSAPPPGRGVRGGQRRLCRHLAVLYTPCIIMVEQSCVWLRLLSTIAELHSLRRCTTWSTTWSELSWISSTV